MTTQVCEKPPYAVRPFFIVMSNSGMLGSLFRGLDVGVRSVQSSMSGFPVVRLQAPTPTLEVTAIPPTARDSASVVLKS
jgi:hypothetical protein